MSGTLPPALVLTAGLGRRLHPLTLVRAKPAVPVAGTPLVVRVLRWLGGRGVTEAVLNLHHRPDTITREVGHGLETGVRVRYSWEPRLLGSAGGPRLAAPLLGPRFFVVNGDSLTDLSLHTLVDRHLASRAAVTLAVTPHPAPDRYGGVDVDAHGRVRGFRRAGDGAGAHFIGVQLVEGAALATLRPGEPAQTVGGLYDRMIAETPDAVRAVTVDAPFHDVGTVADYLATTRTLASRPAGCATGGEPRTVADPPTVAASAQLVRTTVWDRVTIGARCRLVDCIVTDDVVLPDDTTLADRICIATRHAPCAPGTRIGNTVVYPIDRGASR